METVILCGGKGTRLASHTESVPKPLIEIGGRPILWHVMKYYAHSGHRDFVLCLGYLAGRIKEFFATNQAWRYKDFVLRPSAPEEDRVELLGELEDWCITFADTGLETDTGGRVKRVQDYVRGDDFLANYSDGLSDVDLGDLIAFHQGHGKVATLVAVNPESQFGVLEVGDDGAITKFQEKPPLETWINGGFFVFKRAIFDYLDENCNLENDGLATLAAEGELMAYRHRGFWRCMDTYKDAVMLNQLWTEDRAPWRVWES